ncbi:hypothetical protein LENED_011130 [Lentinula edodes]|uniref:Uncharacterized protein n=1 Tax=Lentinula edodes TaxID=5353 RepID=A0A1Q3EP86_LENED|nr:hypothetical protein LENED_011130 [Lentinula edodes]
MSFYEAFLISKLKSCFSAIDLPHYRCWQTMLGKDQCLISGTATYIFSRIDDHRVINALYYIQRGGSTPVLAPFNPSLDPLEAPTFLERFHSEDSDLWVNIFTEHSGNIAGSLTENSGE